MATTNYYLTLTDYGQQRLAAASAGLQTVQLKSLVLGDANNQPYDPASRTGFNALVNQKASVALSGITVKGGRTDIEAVIPIEVGGFRIYEVGITDETGGLIYVGNFHGGYKPALNEGAAGDMQLNFTITSSQLASLVVTLDPNKATEQRKWVSDNFAPKLTPTFQRQGGEEGAEIHLQRAETNTQLQGDLVVDIWRDYLRIWAQINGQLKGAYLYLPNLKDGIGSRLAVNEELCSFRSFKYMNADLQLTSDDVGRAIQLAGNGKTAFLPAGGSVPEGRVFYFYNNSGGTAYVAVNQATVDKDFIYEGVTNTRKVIGVGRNQSLMIMSRGGIEWDIVGGTASKQFETNNSLQSSGYQILDSGLILQWTNVSIPAASTANVNFPIVFPNAVFGVFCQKLDGSLNGTNYRWDCGTPSLTGVQVVNNWDKNTIGGWIFAIGK